MLTNLSIEKLMKCIVLIFFSALNLHITKILFEMSAVKFTGVLLASAATSLIIYHILFYIYKPQPYDKYFFSAAYGISWLLPLLTSQYSIAIMPFLFYNHFIYCMFVCEDNFKKPNFILLFVSAMYALWSFLLYVRMGFDTYLFLNIIPTIMYSVYLYNKQFDNHKAVSTGTALYLMHCYGYIMVFMMYHIGALAFLPFFN